LLLSQLQSLWLRFILLLWWLVAAVGAVSGRGRCCHGFGRCCHGFGHCCHGFGPCCHGFGRCCCGCGHLLSLWLQFFLLLSQSCLAVMAVGCCFCCGCGRCCRGCGRLLSLWLRLFLVCGHVLLLRWLAAVFGIVSGCGRSCHGCGRCCRSCSRMLSLWLPFFLLLSRSCLAVVVVGCCVCDCFWLRSLLSQLQSFAVAIAVVCCRNCGHCCRCCGHLLLRLRSFCVAVAAVVSCCCCRFCVLLLQWLIAAVVVFSGCGCCCHGCSHCCRGAVICCCGCGRFVLLWLLLCCFFLLLLSWAVWWLVAAVVVVSAGCCRCCGCCCRNCGLCGCGRAVVDCCSCDCFWTWPLLSQLLQSLQLWSRSFTVVFEAAVVSVTVVSCCFGGWLLWLWLFSGRGCCCHGCGHCCSSCGYFVFFVFLLRSCLAAAVVGCCGCGCFWWRSLLSRLWSFAVAVAVILCRCVCSCSLGFRGRVLPLRRLVAAVVVVSSSGRCCCGRCCHHKTYRQLSRKGN